ncbi:MAG: tetratricopeptide repeat protein, partial [Anaerolineae bacterium]|nr:tetratricopeptide repeat protein [Anaerolineae bacterium]
TVSTQTAWKELLAGVARLRGTGLSVYDYLASEVFAQQAPEVQRFLLATSVLDEMNARRCNALLGIDDADQMLELLEQGNIFIVRFEKEQERWYRYHALFQGFLRQKLAADAPEEATALHLRAAAILEEEGEWDGVFRLHMAAGDLQGAVRVAVRAAQEMYEAGRLETLAQWIDQIPDQAQVPRLIWYRGRVCAETGEWARALELYERARRGFEQRGEAEAAAQTLVDAGVSLRFLGRLQEAIQSAQEALERLAQPGPTASLIAAGARRNLGICLCQMGRAADGIDHLREALRLYTEGDSVYGRALTHGDLGVALGIAGNLAAAELHNEEALRLWQQMGHSANMATALNSLAMAQQLRGEYEAALATLDRGLDSAQRAGSRRLQALLLAGKGDVYRERGEWEQAVAAYGEARQLAEAIRYPSVLRHLLNATAEVHRARGEYPQALALARQAYDQAIEQGLPQHAARCGITLAAIYLEQGNPALAEEYLQRAVETLSAARAGRELALAWLQLARVAHARADVPARQECIRRMVEVTLELGYDHFLVGEVARALPVVEPVMQAGVGGGVLADLVRRARQAAALAPAAAAGPSEEVRHAPLRIEALGACNVYAGGRLLTPADWGTAKAKELFFYLLAFPSRRKEQVAEVLWPDLSAGRLRSAFHVTLYRVRRALGMNDCVLYDNEQYLFNRQLDYWYDVEEFESLLTQAESLRVTSPLEAESALEKACALYKGEYLEGMSFPDDEWCFWRREELARRYHGALQQLGDLRAERSDYAGALEAYRRLIACDPLREDIHREIMRCLALSGDRNAALRHYRTVVALLREELAVEPLPETSELYRTIAEGREERVL